MKTIKPVYLIAGGPQRRRESHDPLLAEILAETGRANPSVAYIGAASADNPQFFKMIKTLLTQNGAGEVSLVPLAAGNYDPTEARSLLESSDVIFFSGGDVELGMQSLGKHHVMKVIHKRIPAGVVLAGLSAGSILLAAQWVRWRDPDDDSTAEPFDCLGIVPLICDMHDEDDGWAELQILLRLRAIPGEIGYGIPASSGLRIHPNNRIEAIGGNVHRFVFKDGRVETIADLGPSSKR